MDNGKATPEWAGHEYYACTNNYYGTTKKFQIAYRAHATTGIYTTDSGYYFPDGTTNRTVSINTEKDGYVYDLDTFPGFSYCYIPAEKVADTPVPLISVDTDSLYATNATWTIDGTKVEGKEGMVLSNCTYTVTYKADPGYCFEGAKTEKTVDLVTTNCASAYVPSEEKPDDPVVAPTDITIDATAVADGTNTFNTLDAAFQAPFTQCATNLVLKDRFTTLSQGVLAYPATNNLQVITFQGDTGSGYLLIHENHVNAKGEKDALALAANLQALVAEGSGIKVRTAAQTVSESDMWIQEDVAAFESIALTDPWIAGDVELIAPTKTITGTLSWDVSGAVALLHDFDSITNEVTKYAIDVGSVTPSTGIATYTLATKAGSLSAQTFAFITDGTDYASLAVGSESNVVYNGMVYTLAMTNETDLVLTMDGDFVPEQLAAVKMMSENAVAEVAKMHLLQAMKSEGYGMITSYYYPDTTNDVCNAKDTAAVDKAVSGFADNIDGVLKTLREYEAKMPTTITIDANAVEDGTNTFNTLDAAFKAPMTPCATNLVLTGGIVTLSAGFPADKSPDGATNSLQVITGSGYLLIDENHVNAAGANDAEALAENLQALVADGSGIKVRWAANNHVGQDEDVLWTDVAAFESIKLPSPWISGDVELIAPTTTITGTLAWDFLSPMSSPVTLENFDDITSVTADLAIELGTDIATNTYTLATKATKLEGQTFTFRTNRTAYAELTVGQDGDVVYNGQVYTLAMDGTSLTMTVDGDYVPEQLAAVDTAIADARADLYAIGLSEEEVSYSTNRLATIRETAVAAINAATNKAAVAEALVAQQASIDKALETARKLADASVRVAGEPYDTVAEAVAAANEGDTVTLRKDVETATTVSVDKDLTLDLGTNTLSAAEGTLALDVTNAIVWVTGQPDAAIASAHVAQPGAVNCKDATSVQAPEGYGWIAVPGEDYYTLAQTTEPFTGAVTISTNLTADASWVMTLENANITVDKVEGTGTLAAITNNLIAIQGTGTIFLNAKDTEYRNLLRSLVLGDGVTVYCVMVVPKEDVQGAGAVTNLSATVSSTVEDPDSPKTVVGGMKTESGDVSLTVDKSATKPVEVQDGIAGKYVAITNYCVTEPVTVPELKGDDVYIENYGHLESDTTATNNLYILNAAANTLVGEYTTSKGDITITGEYGSLSNVTITSAGTLTFKGTNIVSGPVTLDAKEVETSESTLLFSVAGGNGTCSINFGRVQASQAFGVIVDDETTAGTYPLAMNASVAAQILTRKNMSLVKDNSVLIEKLPINTNNLAIVDGVAYGLTLTNGELKAVVKLVADYTASISNTAASACADILAMTRLTDAEKATATNAVMTLCKEYVSAVLGATDTDGAEENVVAAQQLINHRCAAAQKLGDNKPYSITIDATAVADGTNVFNTLDAAFKSVDTQFATNLVIKGNVGLSKKETPVAPATNNLTVITGKGRIIIAETRADADSFASALRALAGTSSGVEVCTTPYSSYEFDRDVPFVSLAASYAIDIYDTSTITNGVVLTAPRISNYGTLNWNLTGNNHDATLAEFDNITQGPNAKFAISLDNDQASGDTIGNYVIATGAFSATDLTFTLTGPSPFGTRTLSVGAANTIYVGAKAFTLTVNDKNELVFDIAWGKFRITYDAAGGTFADASEANIDAYVNKGYDFPAANPTRAGYTFKGWYRSWKNGAEQVTKLDTTMSPVLPLKAHTLYAQWTRTAATVASLSDMKGTDDPRVEITMADGFVGSRTLTTLNMPLYVTKIGQYAFRGATKLTAINFVQPHKYTDFSKTTLTIDAYAFGGATGLKSIVIPEYVTSIGASAFVGCSSLTDITFLGDLDGTSLGTKPFVSCGGSNGITIHLSPKAAANTALVYSITNGATAKVVIDARLAGEINPESYEGFSVGSDTLSFRLKVTDGTPVTMATVSALFAETPSGLSAGEYLEPTEITVNGDVYTIVFDKPKATSGFLRLCINPQNAL